MTDAQTHNAALALVAVTCTRGAALGAIRPGNAAFSALGGPVACQVLVLPPSARIRRGRNAPSSAPAALPRSP